MKEIKKKRIRTVQWICDKKHCDNTVNTREIISGDVLNDDVCDFCHKAIHEPLLIDLKND